MDNQQQLPDRDHGWSDEQQLDFYGLTVAHPDERARFPNKAGFLEPQQAALVVGGIEDYLDERADREIDVPSAYKDFEDFETYIGSLTAGAGSNYIGDGVDARRLEQAVRFATGGGRFRSGDLTVIGCGGDPFVVQYDGRSYIVVTTVLRASTFASSFPLRDEREIEAAISEWPTHDVAGFDVIEDDPEMRIVLERALRYVDRLDVEVTGYKELREGKHVFETASGRDLYLKGFDLKKLNGIENPDEVEGEHTIETSRGEEYTVSWDGVEYDIGDPYDDWYMDDVGIVTGYQIRWEDPRTSRRVSMDGKIHVNAVYKVLRLEENESYDSIKVREEKESLGKFKADGWSPVSPPTY